MAIKLDVLVKDVRVGTYIMRTDFANRITALTVLNIDGKRKIINYDATMMNESKKGMIYEYSSENSIFINHDYLLRFEANRSKPLLLSEVL